MLMHHVMAALRAPRCSTATSNTSCATARIVIVDEFTGRTMPDGVWSDGLHQAIEGEGGVRIQPENQTLASITFQNFFRLYDKLSGMTGTADTEGVRVPADYGCVVIVIPNQPADGARRQTDLVYLTQREKYRHRRGHPRLQWQAWSAGAGRHRIDRGLGMVSNMLQAGIEHQVLNAKHHEARAQTVARPAGQAAVTIATNMAGRGTDIVLGGNLEVEWPARRGCDR